MLTLVLPKDGEESAVEIQLEHSLASISKWESLHEKAFFSITKEDKTEEETKSYVRCMLVSPDLPSSFVERLAVEDYTVIGKYLNSEQTATTFSNTEPQRRARQEPITAELVYYWMMGFQIPFQPCEDWPFNRLMTLIRIAGIKQTKPKRMPREQQLAEMKRLNDQRRAQLGTHG